MLNKTMTIQQAAQMALDIQDACNMGGIARSFQDAMDALAETGRFKAGGTEWRNRHPITVLIADKIRDLSAIPIPQDTIYYSRAYDECKRLAAGGTLDTRVWSTGDKFHV